MGWDCSGILDSRQKALSTSVLEVYLLHSQVSRDHRVAGHCCQQPSVGEEALAGQDPTLPAGLMAGCGQCG